MDRRTTVPAALVAVAGLLVVSACVQGDAEPDTEPAASVGENPEPSVAPQEEVLPLSVRVTDDPPLELQFSRSLTARQRDVVNSELGEKLSSPRGPAIPTAAEYDLNGDGSNEVLVILDGNAYCGSGDVCNIWIFEQSVDGWTWLNRGEDAGSCLSVLPTATAGYRDIRLHGQCAVDMCTFDIRFDGVEYTWDGNRDCEPIPELN